MHDLILAGDTGGTKTLLSLFKKCDGNWIETKSSQYSSSAFNSLEDIIEDFLQGYTGAPQAAAFGIPGPVVNGLVKSTNLPWIIDEQVMQVKTGIPRVKLVNDLTATAYSLLSLTPDELVQIKPGATPKEPERYIVLAPGTGLGQSFLLYQNGKKTIIPSEGGHVDFAPTTELELQLCQYLLKKYRHVSYERVLSGNGIPNILDFLMEVKDQQPLAETIEKLKTQDKAMVISSMALEQKDAVCAQAMDIFVSLLGTVAGNLALSFLPDGGIYLGGGIPHKILPQLKGEVFVRRFLDKGRMRPVLEPMPVMVITNNRAALKGAAQIAIELNNK